MLSLPVASLARLRPTPVGELVRIGRVNDGGYVISRAAMDAADVLIGLGVNTDWSFEAEFLRQNASARLIMVDGSVGGGDFYRQGLTHVLEMLRHARKGRWSRARQEWRLGGWYRELSRSFSRFLLPPGRVFINRMLEESSFAGGLTIDELVTLVESQSSPPARRWFVKMDIEGSEYRVLPQLMRYADRITGLAVEFHDCDLLWPRLTALLDLLGPHFVLVHTHGNNCAPLIDGSDVPRVLELSFLNRSLVPSNLEPLPVGVYPLPGLDMPNDPARPDYTLTFRG